MADYAIHDTTLIGISDVIRKKEGSSALIDPAEYAERVNLMGMLEEKIASSASICSFSDGADDVPMSSVIAHIAPTLTGVNAVNMVQTGKNLLQNLKYQATANRVNIGQSDDGFSVSLKKGTYTLSVSSSINIRAYYRGENDGSNTLIWSTYSTSGSGTFTLSEDKDVRMWVIGQDGSVNASDVLTIQLEVGSTATSYEAYEAPTDYTANLGRTVYGADADLVSGQGSENCTNRNLVGEGFTWSYNTTELSFPYFTIGSNAPNKASNKNFVCDGYVNNGNYRSNLQDGEIGVYNNTSGVNRFCVRDDSCTTLEQFLEKNGNTKITYEVTTPTPFTFDGQEIPSLLGVNNIWHDAGETEAVYRSSGTVTPVPIQPVLISKTITENGTYSAEDDNADGYDEVTVNVQGGGEEPFVPQFSETKIADNSSHASSFTLSEDYANYDMVKIVWYESATVSGFLYTTPDILDEIFSVGVGKLCINKPSTNYYICYSKSGLTWTQTNQRNIYVHEIYGVTFTNCTMTATDLYKRGASTTTKYAITSQTSLKDYDLFVMSSIHATDGSETMPTTWLYQYPKENMSDAFSCPVPTVLQEYNANDEAFVISEYGMTSARFFMVQGIKFTPTPSLLSMSPAPTPSEPDSEDPEEEVEEEET